MSSDNEDGTKDVLKRLCVLESSVTEIKVQVGSISATIPHLATKADLTSLEAAMIKWIIATVIAASGLAFTFAKFVH